MSFPEAPPQPNAVERWAARHPASVDGLLIVAYTVVTAGQLLSIEAFSTAPLGAAALLVAGIPVGVLRRRVPLVSFAIAGSAAALATPVLLVPAVLLVVTSVVTRLGPRTACIGSVIVVGASTAAGAVLVGDPSRAAFGALPLLVGLLFGLWIRTRRAYVRALIDLADRVRTDQQKASAAAVETERARIAREMHDIVAHGLSVVIRLSDGAGAVAARDPERAREVLHRIGDVSRGSLADMRRVLDVLRGDSPADAGGTTPQPTLADLERLVEDLRTTGLPVELRTEDVGPLPESLTTTVYRIVQECLTNAARHARDATVVEAHISRVDGEVVVVVRDDGQTPGDAPSRGSGRGLVGIRERAALYGGLVEAGPVEPHGWRVRVVLHEEAAA